MSFHRQIEQQLAKEFSPNEATILVDYQDVVYHGRRLQAWQMGRLIGIAFRAVVNAVKNVFTLRPRPSIATLDNHLRQDIGLLPTGRSLGRDHV